MQIPGMPKTRDEPTISSSRRNMDLRGEEKLFEKSGARRDCLRTRLERGQFPVE